MMTTMQPPRRSLRQGKQAKQPSKQNKNWRRKSKSKENVAISLNTVVATPVKVLMISKKPLTVFQEEAEEVEGINQINKLGRIRERKQPVLRRRSGRLLAMQWGNAFTVIVYFQPYDL